MARRKKRKKKPKMDAATRARRMARATLGPPPSEKVMESPRKKKRPKHKGRQRDEELG